MTLTADTPVSVSHRSAVVAFALGSLFFAYAFVQRVAPSVMTNELMRDFSVGAAALGSLSAFYFYAYASIQLPVGVLTDRFGPRKLMSTAAGLCALASLAFALSESLWMASVARALVGVTVAFAFVGTMAIAGYWFRPAQYAMLAGMLQAIGMCGAIFGQAPLRYVVETIGWRGMSEAMAVVAVMLAGLIYWLVPKRSESQKEHSDSGPGIWSSLRGVAGNPQTWLCALIGFGMAATMLGFGGLWGVPWLSTIHGYTTTQAAGIVSMLFAGWALFSPAVGWYSDYIGRRNPIVIIGAIVSLCAFSVILFFTPESTPVLMLMVFLTGAGGSAMTVAFSTVKELNDIRFSSTSLGLMNMCIVGSGAVMQPLIGALLDLQWDGTIIDGVRIYTADAYQTAMISFLLVNAAALIGAFFVRETRCRQIA